MRIFHKLSNGLAKVEGVLASLALLFMITVAFLQVVLRNGWDTGIGWGDPVVRALVLWVGFLGASIATHEKGHIRFDVISKFLPSKVNRAAEILVFFASATVCLLLAQAAREFVMMEKEFGTTLANILPSWIVLIILPISFLIMAFRMALLGLDDLVSFFRHSPKQEEA